MPDRPICFVISPIGEEEGEIRKRSDLILKHVITPVADACGYQCLRADKISESGMITTQVINHIIDDPMVVADLTGPNANVFYELAVRHAAQKPFVQIIQKGETIPFDLSGIRTIEIDHKDLESAAAAKQEMEKQMRGMVLPGARIENPISIAVDFDKLRRSDNPEKRQLADILNAISDLRGLLEKRASGTFYIDPNSISDRFIYSLLKAKAGTGKSHTIQALVEVERLQRLRDVAGESEAPPIEEEGKE